MKTPKPLYQAVTAVAALTALSLTACAPDDDPAEFEDNDADATETEPAGDVEEGDVEETEASEDENGEDEPDAENGSGEDPAAADDDAADSAGSSGQPNDVTLGIDDALQTITYPMTSGRDGEITMGIQSPVVNEQGMLLTVTFIPDYDDSDGTWRFHDDMHNGRNIDVHLLPLISDRANFKSYYVPNTDGDKLDGWLSYNREPWVSTVDTSPASGEVVSLWAYFPAPEDDIDVVDIAVVPGVQEFRDVPVEWGDFESDDFYGESESEDGDDE